MSRRRAPGGAGSRVGGGRLRVDAARAVGKLRDYQLAEPAMWALEAIRAGAAMGASAVHVDGDADDVWVAWEGEPLATADLTRLLDELVSPAGDRERRPLRLLATAINTALGLGPRYVDVYAIEGGAGVRARYAPGLLTTGDEGAAEGLRNLTATPAALPAGAPAVERGALVHLRRFPALEALSLLATGQEPREVRLARRACEDFPLPLRIGHGPLARHHAPGDLLRVRIDDGALGEGREAFLAITELARLEPHVDYAELGVVLATHPLQLGLATVPGAHVPIRARIDAPRLPTNASRSAIRRDDAGCLRAEELLAKALPVLIARLVRELGPDAEAEWTPKARARLRAAALVLAAAPIAGADWRERALSAPEVLAPLLDAPIARDAIGRPRSIRELAQSDRRVAHTGAEPLPEELEPWVGDVPWVPPGDPLARLWGGAPPPTAIAVVHEARASREARTRWLARPARAVELAPDPSFAVVVPLRPPGPSARSCVPDTALRVKDLRGEIAVVAQGAPHGAIALLIDGRETELARRESPVPFRAIATAPALRLVASHDAVEDDDAKRAVLRACAAAVVVGCEALARHLSGRRPPPGETARFVGDPPPNAAALVRAGARLALSVREHGADEGRAAFLGSHSPLLSAPAWPTVAGAQLSLDAIAQAAKGTGGVGWVAHTPGVPLGLADRIVLVLDEHERELIELLVGAGSLIDYRDRGGPAPSADSIARALRARCVATLAFERRGRRGAIGWAREGAGSLELSHVGVVLATGSAGATAAATHLVIDDDTLVPSHDWRSLRHAPATETDADALEAELAAALIDAMIGRERADLHAPSMLPWPSGSVVDALFSAAAELSAGALAKIGPERVGRLREVPLFRRAFGDGRVTMTQACASLGGELVYVRPASVGAGPVLADFDPVVLDPTAAHGVSALFGARTRHGSDELARRQATARREERLVALRSRPARPLELPGCRPVVRVTGQGLTGLLGLARPGSDRTHIEIRIEGRHLCGADEPLPGLEAVVDGDPALADDELRALSDAGLSRVRGAVRDASARLILEIVTTLDRPLAHDEPSLQLVRAWSVSAADRKRGTAKKVLAALRTAPIFATVQGGRASLADATSGKQVRIAEPVDRWLEPGEGEAETLVDRPILAYPTVESHPARVILDAIAEHGLRNVTTDVRRVIAARRVKRGIAGRPRRTETIDERFRWTLEALAETAPPGERSAFEGLGIGEIGFVRDGPSSVAIFEAGTRLDTLSLEIRPHVAIASEPAALRLGSKGITPKDRQRLDAMARTVVARAMRRLIETVAHDELPEWLRLELRACALLGGAVHLAAISEVPVFQSTTGRWVSPGTVQAQAARFGTVWWTSAPPGSVPEPLDPERIVLRLGPNEARQLEPWAACLRADEELRLDAIARANRDRPPLGSIGPAYQEASLALASAQLVERHGTVLALHPAHVATRGLHAHRERKPLGIVPDGSAWPARAWIDDDALTPDRTWSAPIHDAALERARAELAEVCETALEATFETPRGVLAHVRVDRALSHSTVGARGIQVRGVLSIPIGDAPSIETTDAAGESERAATITVPHQRDPQRLPISGRLVIAGAAGPSAGAALTAIARAAYGRMLRTLRARLAAGRSPDPELDVAELVRAATLGCHEADDRSLELDFVVGSDRSLVGLAAALARGDRMLVIPGEQRADAEARARDLGFAGVVVVDDGSLAARRAIAGARSVPLAQMLADAVLGSDEALAPEPTLQPATPPAATPPAATPPAALRPPAPAPLPELTLPGRIASLIAERGALASAIPITVDRLASTPLASLRTGGEVELAMRHEQVRAIEQQTRDDAGGHAGAIAILAAHVIGLAVRGDDDAVRVQLDAIARLLAARAPE